jgi:adenosine deaminase
MKFPKVSLHVHLEATLAPALGKKLAAKNDKKFPEELVVENGTKWHFANKNFGEFLHCYDIVTGLMVIEDMELVTFEYLKSCHEQGVIYVEMTISPDHFLKDRDHFLDAKKPVSPLGFFAPTSAPQDIDQIYAQLVEIVSRGILRAKQEFGIESRIRIALIRHEPKRCLPLVQAVLANPHPFVVGFDLAGAEKAFPATLFEREYALIRNYNLTAVNKLGLGAHVGEHDGPESIQKAITQLGLQRIGHGAQCMGHRESDPIKHQALMKLLKEGNIGIESCPGSNLALNLYPDYAAHPLQEMIKEGLCVSLGDDDPTFEGFVSIEEEYTNTQQAYDLDDNAMLALSKNAIRSAFCQQALKDKLLMQVECFINPAQRAVLQEKIASLDKQLMTNFLVRLESFVGHDKVVPCEHKTAELK